MWPDYDGWCICFLTNRLSWINWFEKWECGRESEKYNIYVEYTRLDVDDDVVSRVKVATSWRSATSLRVSPLSRRVSIIALRLRTTHQSHYLQAISHRVLFEVDGFQLWLSYYCTTPRPSLPERFFLSCSVFLFCVERAVLGNVHE